MNNTLSSMPPVKGASFFETHSRFLLDTLLILVMAVLAACGLIYEYLLSHYAGRVLGSVETAIYLMIGLMIVMMGIGAFAARWIQAPFTGFVIIEVLIALLGAVGILGLGSIIGLTHVLPHALAESFQLPPDVWLNGGFWGQLEMVAKKLPYVLGALLGLLIGMEIPLIARVRQAIHTKHLQHNAGTIYGADYIGAGVGAVIWVWVLLKLDIVMAGVATASINLVAGFVFLCVFWQRLKYKEILFLAHLVVGVVVIFAAYVGPSWMDKMGDLLFVDKVVHRQTTPYQQVVITQRLAGAKQQPIYSLYLNGRLQFSTQDEVIYHELLVQPAMMASARHERVLVIGGGDGLAVREVLKWAPERIDLIDLDADLVALFTEAEDAVLPVWQAALIRQNQSAFSHPSVHLHAGDAFIEVDKFLNNGDYFDSIIVDLPDPSHPNLNKLYSDDFFARLRAMLNADGVLAIQSTSPYHAKSAFISIKKTLQAAGFNQVQQYHQNIPSFGEWGFSVAVKQGADVLSRIARNQPSWVTTEWLTPELLNGAFAFPAGFYEDEKDIKINRLGSQQLYQYHQQGWQYEPIQF